MKLKNNQPTPILLDYILVQEVSPVGTAANGRKFLKIKSVEGAPMKIKLSANVKKTLEEVCKKIQDSSEQVSKMVSDSEVDDAMGENIPEELGSLLQSLCETAASVSVSAGPTSEEPAPEAKAEPPMEGAPAAESEVKAEPPPEEMTPEDKAAAEALKEAETKAAACTPETKPAAKAAEGVPEDFLKSAVGEIVREVKKSLAPAQVMTPPQGRSQVEPPRAAPSEDSVWEDFGSPTSMEFRKKFRPHQ